MGHWGGGWMLVGVGVGMGIRMGVRGVGGAGRATGVLWEGSLDAAQNDDASGQRVIGLAAFTGR